MALGNLSARIPRRWLWAMVAAAALLVPPAVVLADYMRFYRVAALITQGYALRDVHMRLLSEEAPIRNWVWDMPMLEAWRGRPTGGAYRDYPYATEVKIKWLWRPIASRFIGGPYVIQTQAVAAVLRTEEGKWMVLRVE